MFKSIADAVFSFDCEWIPDPMAAELLAKSDTAHASYEDAFKFLWDYTRTKKVEEDPTPFVKTQLCRLVSVSGIFRRVRKGNVTLELVTLPRSLHAESSVVTESSILLSLLAAVGAVKPQLVGYNSNNADVLMIVQRAIANGLSSCGFAKRPEKPWEGADYFAQFSDYSIDLSTIVGKWGSTPKLHEVAVLSGIPGKLDVSGGEVWKLWLEGKYQEIINYNEFDAFTTHLLWARVAHFADLLTDEAYENEQQLVRELLQSEIQEGKTHLEKFIVEWDRLKVITDKYATFDLNYKPNNPCA